MQNALEIYAQNLARPIADKVDEQTHLFTVMNNNLLQIVNRFDGLSQSLDRNVAARTQPAAAAPAEPLTGHPDKILKKLDKGLARVSQDLRGKMSKRLSTLDSHLEHLEKYPEGRLQKVFQQEADKTWQFAQEYKITAAATSVESDAQLADMSETYDIGTAWSRLRRQHAAQCQKFLREHSTALVEAFKLKLTPEKIRDEANIHLDAFFVSVEGVHYSEAERYFFKSQVLDFLTLSRRQLLSTSGRAKVVMAEDEKKRKEALEAATAVYEAADLKTLLAMAKMHIGQSNQQSFKPGSLMHYLTTDQDTKELPKQLQDYLKLARSGKLKLGDDGQLIGLPKPYDSSGASSSSSQKRPASSSRKAKGRAKSLPPKPKQRSRTPSRGRTPPRPATPSRKRTPSKQRSSSAQQQRGRSPNKAKTKSKSPKSALAKTTSRSASRQKSVKFRRWGPKRRG
eukprot:TRINITY_DN12126_c0_g2_i3.p2 TRINITY_DN12126_c0_g2~~TRINITY_DN12126_c0_g2_i3.p2  ORF type:complete len:454 (-),score=88.54 TRINITY_DN12126_c0_g2_i3:1992-3353(-)